MTQVSLSAVASGTLNGAGAGTIKVGPTGAGVLWLPEVASIRMTGAVPSGLATCSIYAGDVAQDQNFVDATYDVNRDSTDRVKGSRIRIGQSIWAVWAGGNPGATITLSVTGLQEVP